MKKKENGDRMGMKELSDDQLIQQTEQRTRSMAIQSENILGRMSGAGVKGAITGGIICAVLAPVALPSVGIVASTAALVAVGATAGSILGASINIAREYYSSSAVKPLK